MRNSTPARSADRRPAGRPTDVRLDDQVLPCPGVALHLEVADALVADVRNIRTTRRGPRRCGPRLAEATRAGLDRPLPDLLGDERDLWDRRPVEVHVGGEQVGVAPVDPGLGDQRVGPAGASVVGRQQLGCGLDPEDLGLRRRLPVGRLDPRLEHRRDSRASLAAASASARSRRMRVGGIASPRAWASSVKAILSTSRSTRSWAGRTNRYHGASRSRRRRDRQDRPVRARARGTQARRATARAARAWR